MNKPRINIAISGLGLVTTEKLKLKLREVIPSSLDIHWGKLNEAEIHLVLIHEFFFETANIQKIIFSNNLAYLKISKDNFSQKDIIDHTLYLPIQDTKYLKSWLETHVLAKLQIELAPPLGNLSTPSPDFPLLDVQFIADIYDNLHRKVHIFDQLGSLAIVDHHQHCVWINSQRTQAHTDGSLQYNSAIIEDFSNVSRKYPLNLEDWLFELVWNSHHLCILPHASAHFKIKFWPQPTATDRKLILQLSACFIQGAEIQHVANKLGIDIEVVQRFINANLAIHNAELVNAKTCQFDQNHSQESHQDVSTLRSFFGKLKRRFGF
ncbi:hypothetical protein DJ533_05400 [Acinetobacter defluvii]|uniref:Uncharacterized protein n=1 Tax=Acinetobacter defluvii TaxID=1871111 RepID=A0A2S2FAY4_9GAMM|nr:hypothetical protein [Acinetobacter defluvii]AWL28058.1 hypothetical protein DJ533_05400 [Acinetobacter defluvii]